MPNEIVKTSIASFLQKIFLNLSSFIITIVLSRMLTVSEFGIFSLVNAIIFFLIIFFSIGIQASMARFLSLSDDREYRHSVLAKGLGVLLPWVVLCTGIYLIFYAPIIDFIFPEGELKNFTLIIYAIALIEVVRLFIEKASHGISRLGIAAEQSAYTSLLLVLLLVSAAYIYSSAESVLYAKIIALALPIPFALTKLILEFKKSLNADAPHEPSTLTIVSYGIPLSLIFLADYGFLQLPLIFLGSYLDPSAVGLYSISILTYVRLLIVPRAIGNGLAPHMARMNHDQNWFSLLEKGVLFALIFSIPIVIIGCTEGGELLALIFGEKYREAKDIFLLLSLFYLMSSLLGVINPILDFSGRAKTRAFGVSVGSVINILLNILWIPKYGIYGAAIATLVGYFIFFIIVIVNLKSQAISAIILSRPIHKLLFLCSMLLVIFFIFRAIFPSISFLILLIILSLIYPILLICSGIVSKSDFRTIFKN